MPVTRTAPSTGIGRSTSNAIEVVHVNVAYGSQKILDNVSFAIPQGAYVGVVGPNGGGKTTMLKIILGLLQPQSGTATVFGKTPREARKAGTIGYVPQSVSQTDFSFPATVAEIVKGGRVPQIGIGRRMSARDREAIEHAMKEAGITHLRNRLIGGLSGGERQKAFIARALASEPRLLILDEPTTGVDPTARHQFYALLKTLNERGLTILYVSHDVEVMQEVSFVLALNQKLLCHCSSHEFLTNETLHRLYGGDVEIAHHHTH
ncbi:MAG TPA: metal ABC transporter ATP-binding protein [Candidatus Peribacteraceae bacterium]|nr:metal ABC transporter ATP-binding protein [Candidatus Peribacteraceae bacterium]